jgi:hypothetical protein
MLIDDDLDQSDPILGSTPLKALLCRVTPTESSIPTF